MRETLIGTALIALLISGCASDGFLGVPPGALGQQDGYSEFYKPESELTPESMGAVREAAPTDGPRVVHLAKYDSDARSIYTRQGYMLIGQSNFTSGYPQSDQDAIQQGVSVGADLVIVLDPQYAETRTGVVPITTPGTVTSYSSGTYGSSTTTTYGTNTTYVPMSADRYSYSAGYFVKWRFRFGALFRDLTDEERQQLQTNRGAYVRTVIDNTPAYNADVLPGDVIVALNGQTLTGQAALSELINSNRGQAVDLTIIRGGRNLSKRVSIAQ